MANIRRRDFLHAAAGLLATRGAGAASSAAAPGLDAARFAALRRFVDTPYGKVAYVARGAGRAVLMLHGFPLNGFQWRGAIERLAPYSRCIAPDFLGMGHSCVAAPAGVGPDSQVRMLTSLLDSLAIAQVDVIANDSGGAVAQLLAVHQPTRVRTLLLTNCDTELQSPPPAMLPVIELAKQGRFVHEWLAPWHADPTLARSAKGLGGLCYADAAHPTDEALHMYFGPVVDSAQRAAALHRYAIALERNSLAGIAPALQRCRIPTRIVWGMDDTIFDVANADYLDRIFGNSHGVRRLAGAKLFWPEERPDIIAAQARILWESAQG